MCGNTELGKSKLSTLACLSKHALKFTRLVKCTTAQDYSEFKAFKWSDDLKAFARLAIKTTVYITVQVHYILLKHSHASNPVLNMSRALQ